MYYILQTFEFYIQATLRQGEKLNSIFLIGTKESTNIKDFLRRLNEVKKAKIYIK